MILIKTDKCENEIDARSKERDYIEKFKPSLNKIKRPYVSEEEKKDWYKEYYGEHREEILEQKKEYWQNKREDRLEYRQEYYDRERDNILESVNAHSWHPCEVDSLSTCGLCGPNPAWLIRTDLQP